MDSSPAAPDDASRRRRLLPLLLVSFATDVVVLDQVTKYLVVRNLAPDDPVSVVDGWLQLRLIRNSGAAFSFATGTTWVFTLIAAVVSVVILRLAPRVRSLPWALALGFLLGGAVGNLADRLFRAPGAGQGHVVDFIEYLKFPFMNFPVFNVADSFVVVAAFLIGLLGVLGIGLDGRRLPAGDAGGQGTDDDARPGRPAADRQGDVAES